MQIEVHDIFLSYNLNRPDAFEAIKGITLNIEKGDFVALVGKTGSGKSTLIQCFNSLLSPSKGYVKIDEFYITADKKLKKSLLKEESKEVKKNNKRNYLLRKKVGMVFQFPEYQLFEDTVLKDVMFGPKNFKIPEEKAKTLAKEALKKVGINENYYEKNPFELSGGEKRRVAIAGVLASQPDILVLDEPTAGLDPQGKKEIMNLVMDIHKQGKTIILVTHDMDVVKDYVNKVFVLNDGKLIKETKPNVLFKETDLSKYSLEIPTFYKFIKLLKNLSFKGNLDKIETFSSLIDEIVRVYND